ncbi:hypothetical protein MKEN_01260300 [Mycena kentingensis (nom. inval.)]|nr:hypothetical protein MKEN_01260300 [Mycena kentingensis (nom. inval.)]
MPVPAPPEPRPRYASYHDAMERPCRVQIPEFDVELAAAAIQAQEKEDTSWDSSAVFERGFNNRGDMDVGRYNKEDRHNRLKEAHKDLKERQVEDNKTLQEVQAALERLTETVTGLRADHEALRADHAGLRSDIRSTYASLRTTQIERMELDIGEGKARLDELRVVQDYEAVDRFWDGLNKFVFDVDRPPTNERRTMTTATHQQLSAAGLCSLPNLLRSHPNHRAVQALVTEALAILGAEELALARAVDAQFPPLRHKRNSLQHPRPTPIQVDSVLQRLFPDHRRAVETLLATVVLPNLAAGDTPPPVSAVVHAALERREQLHSALLNCAEIEALPARSSGLRDRRSLHG